MTPRQVAIRAGDKLYYTAKPCKRGHLSMRYVSSNDCVECLQARHMAWRRANLDLYRAIQRNWIARARSDGRVAREQY